MFAALIVAIVGFIVVVLGLRFLFLLIGANPASQFVSVIYDWSGPLVAPFAGILGRDSSIAADIGVVTQSVFDWTTLIALIIYGFIGGLIARVVAR